MDDCNLDKLSIKPGKLSPVFEKDVTEYSVTLGSNIEKLTLDYLTSDTGASCCIKGGDGGRTVPLKEGEINIIKLEVTAEDGTTKIYIVNAHRLSARDAKLSDLKVGKSNLQPDFSADIYEYFCVLPCDAANTTVTPTVTDAKTTVTVNGAKPGTASDLNVGSTTVVVQVTSADGSNTQDYKVCISRKQIPRPLKFADKHLAAQYQCPISLSPLYQPITVKDSSPKHSYSGPIIDHITRTTKVDLLSGQSLDKDWRVEDEDLDRALSQALVCIQRTDGSSTETVKFAELGSQLKNASIKLEGELDVKYNGSAQFKHTVESRGWEKQLQQIHDETNVAKLRAAGDQTLEKYFHSLPQPGRKGNYDVGESPLDYLQHVAYCYATAIKHAPKNAEVHLQLAQALEERYYLEDIYGVKQDKDKGESGGTNLEAKESSRDEECTAICELHGVSAGSPLSLQLKAIDAEYHQLLEKGQSQKADHVQGLFAWKSKQATKEGAAAQKVSDDGSSLGQAYLKYQDALALDDNKAVYHFHVGRMLVVLGEYESAVGRLEAALSLNSKHSVAKFYLGLALSLRPNGPGARQKEAVTYLKQTMEDLLEKHSQFALSPDNQLPEKCALHAEDLLSSSNVHLLCGLLQLGRLLRTSDGTGTMSSEDIFHTAALLASRSLLELSKGDTYRQVEWVLLDAHADLLQLLLVNKQDNSPVIGQRCQGLAALIKHTTIPRNADLLTLQQKTSQILAEIQPCSSQALCILGNSLLARYENDPEGPKAPQLLDDAKKSFRGSIGLEGKPMEGEVPPELKEQNWWQEKLKEEEAKKTVAAAPKANSSVGKPAARGGATAAGRGGAPAARGRGGATAGRGGTTAGRGGVTAGRGSTPTARGGAVAGKTGPTAAAKGVGKPPAARGGTVARGGAAKAPARGGAAAKPSGSSHACDPAKPASAGKRPTGSATKRPASASKRPASATKEPGKSAVMVNKKTHHARLGLANALSKTPDTLTEALKYYNEVIDMAPEVHDAYIDSAEMIVKTDPMAAVDIYCKFPTSANLTFDDAYIFGEIVRLLMKAEKFEDPRLGPNMISLGKVLGIGSLEKYVNILDSKFKTELLKKIYAGVNNKEVDDPDMVTFFKFKCWI